MSLLIILPPSCGVQISFEDAKGWVEELLKQASPNTLIILVANKIDLNENMVVDRKVRY